MNRFERIAKECFWDYDISPEEIERIADSGTKAEKKKLFEKIMYNSTDKLCSVMIFSREDLRDFLFNFQPGYNRRYITKHINILKYLLLNEPVRVEGLEWREK